MRPPPRRVAPPGRSRLVRRRPPRPPIRSRQPASRARALALAALALAALLALWLRPAPAAAPAPPPPPPPAASAPPLRPARPAPRPSARPAPPAAAPSPRDRLLAAVRERAVDLAECEVPRGAPARAATRLRVSRAGVPRDVAFEAGRPLPPELAACARERILRWRFEDVALPSDVELLVTFAFAVAR